MRTCGLSEQRELYFSMSPLLMLKSISLSDLTRGVVVTVRMFLMRKMGGELL